jgi:predicted double-glycine peptidase
MTINRRKFCLSLALGALAAPLAAEEPVFRAPQRDVDHIARQYVYSWKERKRFNVVMQNRDYSCGAAALATVLVHFWGEDVTEEQVLKALLSVLTINDVRDRVENGLTLTDLRRVAVKMGYEAAIGSMQFEKLPESKIPLIVGITVKEYNHFVVYRGFDGYYVYLADPIRGNIRISANDFLAQWQRGLVLAVAKAGDDVDVPEDSPLTLRGDEVFLGRMNEQYVRRRLSQQFYPLPHPPRP